MKTILKVGIMAIVLMASYQASEASAQFFFLKNPLIGKPAKNFTLKTLKGEEKNLTQLRNGGNAIVFFWATWCPHCREQLHQLKQMGAEIEKKGIKIILVDLEESDKQVQAYVDKQQISFTVLLDEEATVGEQYEVVGVPTLIFIDKAGVVKAVEHSVPDNYETIFSKG